MAKETIKARIQLKNDTEENWNKAINFVPLQGEIIIYSADNSHPFSRIKVGDGITTVIKLPFVNTDGINGTTIYADSMINWEANPLFIPKKGDIIIFFDKTKIVKDGSEIEIPGFKIGDGKAYNIDLPFVGDDIIEQLLAHIKVNGHTILSDVPANAVFTDTTYTAGTGLELNNTTFNNNGVLDINSGNTNGTIDIIRRAGTKNVTIPGLNSAAYTPIENYATAAQGTKADNAMPKSGGTFTGNIVLAADPISNLHPATKQYVDNNVSISGTLATGTQIGILNINGNTTTLYTPNEAPMTVQVTQSTTTPTAEFIISTNTESSASLTGVLGSTTAIANGKIIYYMTKYELPASEVTLTLRYASSSNYTAAIPIYSYGTTRSVTPYPASYILTLVYYNNAFYLASNNIAIAI